MTTSSLSPNDLAQPLLLDEDITTTTPTPLQADNDNTDNNNTDNNNTTTMNSFFLSAVSLSTVPMFLFGYHTGVLNAPEALVFPGHSTAAWSAVVSAFCLGGLAGALPVGHAAHLYGRRMGLLAILFLYCMGGFLHFVAPNMWVLTMARFVVGLAGGASTVLTPLYVSEIAPPAMRGSLGTLSQLACVLGILASVLVALPIVGDSSSTITWRVIFLPPTLLGGLAIMAAPYFLVESPTWLMLQYNDNNNRNLAMTNLRRLHGATTTDGIIEMMMQQHLQTDTTTTSATTTTNVLATGDEVLASSSSPHRVFTAYHSLTHYMRDPYNRLPILSALLFPMAQQLSGINAVFYYSTTLFRQAGIQHPTNGTLLAFGVNVVATLVAVWLMDQWGRKTLLTISAGGMFLCTGFIMGALQKLLPPIVAIAAVLMHITFFELGLGCIPFFLASEMITPEYAGSIQSITMSCNWASNFLVGLLFPWLNEYLGPYSFAPFAIVLALTTLFAMVWLPESRGKTPEQVRAQVMQGYRRNSHHPIPEHDDDDEEEEDVGGVVDSPNREIV